MAVKRGVLDLAYQWNFNVESSEKSGDGIIKKRLHKFNWIYSEAHINICGE